MLENMLHIYNKTFSVSFFEKTIFYIWLEITGNFCTFRIFFIVENYLQSNQII